MPEALITTKEKLLIKEDPIQRREEFRAWPITKFTGKQNWSPIHKDPASESNCNNRGKNGHYARACWQRQNNNRTVKKLTEEKVNEPNESLSNSEEKIHHIEDMKNIEEKQKHNTVTKMNGIQKEFITDTGSPVTIIPYDEPIVN